MSWPVATVIIVLIVCITVESVCENIWGGKEKEDEQK